MIARFMLVTLGCSSEIILFLNSIGNLQVEGLDTLAQAKSRGIIVSTTWTGCDSGDVNILLLLESNEIHIEEVC